MSNELAQLLREAAAQLSGYINSAKQRDIESIGHYIVDSSHVLPEKLMKVAAELEAQEPVVVVHRNDAGQIVLQNADGTSFDMSKHIGESFYRHPPTSAVPEGFLEGAQSFKSEMLKASKAMIHPFIEGVFAVWEINSAATQPEPTSAVPDGWKLVPVRPTDEMLHAATGVHPGMRYANRDNAESWVSAYDTYLSMISAAPQGGSDSE